MLDFRLDLIDNLIDSFCSPKRIGRSCSLSQAQLDNLKSSFDHWPDFMDFRVRFVVCTARGQRHETFCHCSHCGLSLGVVRGRACFWEFYTPSDYSH